MRLFTAGIPSAIGDVPDGGCILLSARGKPAICFVVRYNEETRFILNLRHVNQHGDEYPCLYTLDQRMSAQPCLHYANACISPNLTPDKIGMGFYKQGGLTSILFMDANACIVQGSLGEHGTFEFDLISGQFWDGQLSRLHHTTSWKIMVPNIDDRHEELADFTV